MWPASAAPGRRRGVLLAAATAALAAARAARAARGPQPCAGLLPAPPRRLPAAARRAPPRARRAAGGAEGAGAAGGPAAGAGNGEPSLEGVDALLPFPVDSERISDDIEYDGPLQRLRGKADYLEAMRFWSEVLPQRLEEFRVTDKEVWYLSPGEATCRWSCSFVAPLPPTARLRGLPPNMKVLPWEKVAVDIRLSATLTLAKGGQVTRHREQIVSGYSMSDAIARYELLTARRLESIDPISWYLVVLKGTTLDELASQGTGKKSDYELQFAEMVFRNWTYGLLIGLVLYAVVRPEQAERWLRYLLGPG